MGFEPTMTLPRHSGFQDRRHRPLGEPSRTPRLRQTARSTSVSSTRKRALYPDIHGWPARVRKHALDVRRCVVHTSISNRTPKALALRSDLPGAAAGATPPAIVTHSTPPLQAAGESSPTRATVTDQRSRHWHVCTHETTGKALSEGRPIVRTLSTSFKIRGRPPARGA